MPRRRLVAGKYQWTPELAYAVGLLVTDGCLSNDGRHIILRSSDIEQLENFRQCLKLTNSIGSSKKILLNGSTSTHYHIQFGNVEFYRWLQSIGITPAKTYTIPTLPVPDVYFRDFLRGHLDGDGSITSYVDRYNVKKNPAYSYSRFFVTFLSASEEHITWLRGSIFRLVQVRGDLWRRVARDERHCDMWQLKYMKKDSQKLVPWMYYQKDLICLSRKRLKAETALKTISGVQRKKYTFTNRGTSP